MAKQNVTVELFYSGTWNAAATYIRNPITITRGRSDQAGEQQPSQATLTLDNRDGTYNPRNPVSPLYGLAGLNTPIRVKVGTDVRFVGEISEWQPQRSVDFDPDAGKGDAWTQISAAGILRRLGQGSPPVLSPLRRTLASYAGSGLIAYWPLEDEADAAGGASGISGEPSMLSSGTAGVEFAGITREISEAGSFRYGTLPFVSTAAGGRLVGNVPAGESSPIGWAVQAGIDARSDSVTLALLDWTAASGTYRRFRLQYTQSGNHTDVIGYNEAGAPTTLLRWTSSQFIGFIEMSVDAVQNGANIDFRLWMAGDLEVSASVAGTLGRVTSVICNPDQQTPEGSPAYNFGFAHVQVWDTEDNPHFYDGATDPDGTFVYGQWFAKNFEQATDRLERICDEAGITLATVAAPAMPVPRMGSQPDATLPDLIRDVERVTAGVIHETRDVLGLTPRSLESLYNQDPTLTLDYAADEVAPPLEPALDDLPVVNDFTAKRPGGSSARYQLLDGPLSILDPPNGVGVYDSEASLNYADDTYLVGRAGWEVYKGTIDETRYPRVTVDLDAAPSLATDASAVDIGDVIAVTNLPADISPDDLSLVVVGYTESIGSHRRTITFNCAPAEAYRVGVWDDADAGRYDSVYSTLDAEFEAGVDTSMSVAVEMGRVLWVTGSGTPQFPLDIRVSGVRLRVTAISGASSPQTFTVNAAPVSALLAGSKVIPAGTQVRVWKPARWAL